MNPSPRNALRIMLCALVVAISIAAAARAADYQSYVYIDNQSDKAAYIMLWHRSSTPDGTAGHLLKTWCAPPHSYANREVHGATNVVTFYVLDDLGCKDRVWLHTERAFPWHGESVTRWRYLITGSNEDYKVDGPINVR